MARLILIIALLAGAFLASLMLIDLFNRSFKSSGPMQGEADMQTRFSKIAYVLLIVLMFSGAAGAL